jgi:hypothetical protein
LLPLGRPGSVAALNLVSATHSSGSKLPRHRFASASLRSCPAYLAFSRALSRLIKPLADQVLQAHVQRLHPQRSTRLNRRIHLRHLVLTDQVTDRRRADHDLVRRHSAAADLLESAPGTPWRAATPTASTASSTFPDRETRPRSRSILFAAEVVCSVPNTRWPVSAAVSARRMVSRSRSSPTRITSGSSRNAERNASAKPRVSR